MGYHFWWLHLARSSGGCEPYFQLNAGWDEHTSSHTDISFNNIQDRTAFGRGATCRTMSANQRRSLVKSGR